jgi:hypothetical protein
MYRSAIGRAIADAKTVSFAFSESCNLGWTVEIGYQRLLQEFVRRWTCLFVLFPLRDRGSE